MKHIRWKILIITCAVCLLPILLGIYMWNELPEQIAIHFNINNQPDNFASKRFAVFALPAIMAFIQMICCVLNDIEAHKNGEPKKLVLVTKWIIPVMTIVIQTAMLCYSVGGNVDIRRVAVIIISAMFIVSGNYLPKLDHVKSYKLDTQKARKINRFTGFEMVILGILGIISIFFPPVASVVWLLLLIPCTLISVVYAIIITKRK